MRNQRKVKEITMIELLPFLKDMISAPGLSGYETPVRKIIEQAWRPLTDELTISRLGSLHGLRRANREKVSAPPSILYTAHMDAIGLMVASNVDGLLHVTEIGGVDARVLPGQLVTVHGRENLPGLVVQPPAHLLPEKYREKPVPLEYLLIDTGYLPAEVNRLVRVGDLVSFAQTPIEMDGEILAGHSLDDRASVAAITACLQELQGRELAWDVWVAATSQEEETLGGARTSAFELHPDLAVAIDVTFASSPGSPGHQTFPMGKGITLGWGPNIHPALFQAFKELADRLEIPYKLDVMPRMSGTDAMGLQVAAEGIPTMVISIPLRYMHTPVEMISMKDIQRAGRLLAEFAVQLNDTFMDKLAWDV
jgi:putative aminopeptidase FrvX